MHRIVLPCVLALMGIALSTPSHAQFLGKSIDDWVRDLDHADPAKRRAAAFSLGKLGPQGVAAVDPLRRVLAADTSPKVREAAAYSLGELAIRIVAIGKDRELQAVLVRSLRDDEPLVRRSAAFALGCLGADAAAARKDVEPLLSDDRPEVRQSAAWALGRLGDEAIPALRKALADNDPLVLRDTAMSLGLLDPEAGRSALSDLIRLVGHPDVEVRKAALLGLVRVVGPEDAKSSVVVAPLQKALLDGDEEVRRNAAFALSNIGGASAAPAVDVLLGTLRRGDAEQKRQAAAALGNLGSGAGRAVADLVAGLQSDDAELRSNSALALGGIGKSAEAAVAPLVAVVSNRTEPTDLRVKSAVSLSMIGAVPPAVDAAPKLLAIASDPREDSRVRERVLWALRVHAIKLRDMKGVLPAFAAVLKEPATIDNRMVRQDCAYMAGMVFGSNAPAEVFPALLDFLRDESLQVYRNTASLVGPSAQETTSGKTTSRELGEGDGRKLALDALANIGRETVLEHPEIIAEVRRLADSEKTVPIFRKQCREFLRKIGA